MARRIDEEEAGRQAIHDRWVAGRPDGEWHEDQCLFCRFYLPIAGPIGADWGACANAASPRDGRVTFEHDYCDAFKVNDGYFDGNQSASAGGSGARQQGSTEH
jgi:hypothetical protein